MPIASRPDHVAIAVPSIDDALPRWQDELGGRVQWRFHTPTVFRGATLQFAGGSYLEMLMPSDATERTRMAGGPSGFVDAFLDRFGPQVHHVTLKVPELQDSLEVLLEAGFTPRDVNTDDPGWEEAFLRPSEVGGLIVQIAASDRTNEDWAAENGHALPGPPSDGARLLGPQLEHDDLARARHIWTVLGAHVAKEGDELIASWPGQPLTIAIRAGDAPRTVGLRFDAVPEVATSVARGAHSILGPPVLGPR